MIGGSDPNLVNPQNKQGYGRNVQTQLLPQPKTTPPSSKPTTPPVTDSMGEQTYQAALQLGVLVRQCFFEILKKMSKLLLSVERQPWALWSRNYEGILP